jgi:hypothetical protein
LEELPRSFDVVRAVEYHYSVVLLATGILHLFHYINDIAMPYYDVLLEIFRDQLPNVSTSAVILKLPENPHAERAEPIAELLMSSISTAGVRLLVKPREGEGVTHCYCRGILQNGSGLYTTKSITRGCPVRRRALKYLNRRISEKMGFLPYGTYPVPYDAYTRAGHWRQQVADPFVPRMLLLLRRKTRQLGDADAIIKMARDAGFNLAVLTPEREPLATQLLMARYADIIVGVHGMALGWVFMMDSERNPHCRRLLELRHFGRPLRNIHNVYKIVSIDNLLQYWSIDAKSVTFDPKKVRHPEYEKKMLKYKKFPHSLYGFSYQRPRYDLKEVNESFWKHLSELRACLPVGDSRPKDNLSDFL